MTPLRVYPIIDSFLVSQCYAIIVLPNGGPDLEAYKFINPTKVGWRQASSLFWQVAKSLSLAEQLVSFEVGFTHLLENGGKKHELTPVLSSASGPPLGPDFGEEPAGD